MLVENVNMNIKYKDKHKRSNKTQTDMWVQAIKRINPDGTKWMPTSSTRICGAHFRSGMASSDHNHPDFVPSVSMHRKPATQEDIDRNQRVRITKFLYY